MIDNAIAGIIVIAACSLMLIIICLHIAFPEKIRKDKK